ncbi:MAG: hypothetical protein VX777_09195 [Chlamydiota bacterium]|nr:hypothetical protein [Chlamydiota bacterium]
MLFKFLLLTLSGIFLLQEAHSITIPQETAKKIGLKIWYNECAGTLSGLSTWNDGEEFASMGIGHFIWYPKGKAGLYKEQFPSLLKFLEDNQVTLPKWLNTNKECPWKNREDFLQDTEREKLVELRTLLVSTVDLQVVFMTQRLEQALPKMLKSVSEEKKTHIKRQFYRVSENPNGLYALLDYINFKGEGASEKERYNNQGWGLLQVLEQMPIHSKSSAIEDFINSAKTVLARRVANSPQERGEKRWLKGWFNRLNSYKNKNS